MRALRFSSSSEEEDEGKVRAKSNASEAASEPEAESQPEENNGGTAEANGTAKRRGEGDAEASTSKKKKGSGIDLEELLAQTYPKEATNASGDDAEQTGALRRSRRRKKKPAKTPDTVKQWSGDEEICVARALMESFTPESGVNINEFYQRGRCFLKSKLSNPQMYEKMRRMKRRFQSIQSMLREGNMSEEVFVYKTPQEKALFQIWKHIWGKNNNAVQNGDQNPSLQNPNLENSNRRSPNPNLEEAEVKEGHGDTDGVQQEEEEERGEENGHGGESGHVNENVHVTENDHGGESGHVNENVHVTENGYGGGRGRVNGNGYARENGSGQDVGNGRAGRMNASFQLYWGFGGGFGLERSRGWCLSRTVKEMVDAVNTVEEELPYMTGEQNRERQQKYRQLRIRELRHFTDYLGLLQEECTLRLRSLENSDGP